MKRDIADRLLQARAENRAVVLVTDLDTGLQALLYDDDRIHGQLGLDSEAIADIRTQQRTDKSGVVETYQGRLFVQVFNPPLRLIIVGAVHIAQSLVPMAKIAGYHVVIVDPRGAWATQERFPDVEVVGAWPDDAMDQLAPDRRTAVVTLTHDPKLDDPALMKALSSPAFYIGALGSRKTHAKRVDRLQEAGLGTDLIGRLHAPVGLSIGAVSPAEIAISIMAQITSVLRADPKPAEKAA